MEGARDPHRTTHLGVSIFTVATSPYSPYLHSGSGVS